jgi:hypothetical protein
MGDIAYYNPAATHYELTSTSKLDFEAAERQQPAQPVSAEPLDFGQAVKTLAGSFSF